MAGRASVALRTADTGLAAGTVPLTTEQETWLAANADRLAEPLGHGYQATVSRIETPDGSIALKRPRGGLLGGWLARRALRREYEAYSRLIGISGIPRACGLTRNGWLVLEHIEGRPLRAGHGVIRDADAFYGRLLATLRAMHAAGVAHGDLKRKDNVIVADGERPFLIDFGIARVRGRSRIDNLLFGVTRQLDLNAWIKLKHGRQPATLPAEDAAIYRPLLIERLARLVRIPWQTLTLRRPRQRLRRWLESRRD